MEKSLQELLDSTGLVTEVGAMIGRRARFMPHDRNITHATSASSVKMKLGHPERHISGLDVRGNTLRLMFEPLPHGRKPKTGLFGQIAERLLGRRHRWVEGSCLDFDGKDWKLMLDVATADGNPIACPGTITWI